MENKTWTKEVPNTQNNSAEGTFFYLLKDKNIVTKLEFTPSCVRLKKTYPSHFIEIDCYSGGVAFMSNISQSKNYGKLNNFLYWMESDIVTYVFVFVNEDILDKFYAEITQSLYEEECTKIAEEITLPEGNELEYSANFNHFIDSTLNILEAFGKGNTNLLMGERWALKFKEEYLNNSEDEEIQFVYIKFMMELVNCDQPPKMIFTALLFKPLQVILKYSEKKSLIAESIRCVVTFMRKCEEYKTYLKAIKVLSLIMNRFFDNHYDHSSDILAAILIEFLKACSQKTVIPMVV